VLLSKEVHALEHVAGARGRGIQALAQGAVLALELRQARAIEELAGLDRLLETAETGLGLQRPRPERGQLLAQVSDQPLQVLQRGQFVSLLRFVV
jgi:hypothetical protein